MKIKITEVQLQRLKEKLIIENLNQPTNFSRMDTVHNNYKAIGYAYAFPTGDGDYEAELDMRRGEELPEDIQDEIVNFTHNGTNCNTCNKRMKRCVIVKDVDYGTIHVVGTECGNNVDDFGMAINRLADKSARAMKVAKLKRQRNELLNKHQGLADAFKVKHHIIQSIWDTFVRYGKLSDKQIEVVLKIAKQQKELQDKWSKESEGAQEINFNTIKNAEMTVISIKQKDSRFGPVTKILLKSPTGYKLYGNLSSNDEIKSGDRVSFSSNQITQSKDDKTFGFFSRGKIIKL